MSCHFRSHYQNSYAEPASPFTALCPGVTRTRSTEQLADALPSLLVSSPEEVAEEGFEAVMAREAIRIPGAPNKTAVMLSQLQPRTITRRIGGIISRFFTWSWA